MGPDSACLEDSTRRPVSEKRVKNQRRAFLFINNFEKFR
jgi:hypothetical protein